MSRGPRSDERPSGWWRRLCQQPWLVGARGPLDFTVSLGILMALSGPKWRNWQTRMIQGHVPARLWGFESPLRHHYESATSGAPSPDSTAGETPCADFVEFGPRAAHARTALPPESTSVTAGGNITAWWASFDVTGTSSLPGRETIRPVMSTCAKTAS